MILKPVVDERRKPSAVSAQTAIECAKAIVDYCKSQNECQNCVFRKYGSEHWCCNIDIFDLREVVANAEAKKKNHGYI